MDDMLFKDNFVVEYDIDLDNEVEKVEIPETFDIDIVNRQVMAKGFAVLYYRKSCTFSKDYSDYTFEIFYGDNAKDNKIISREEATALIDIHELTLVIDSHDGKVWE